jgi:hypothetical protein
MRNHGKHVPKHESQENHLGACFAALVLMPLGATVSQDLRWNDLPNLPFPQDYPTREAADKLRYELLFQRAVQVYL